jgi:hypothetical protein
MKINKKIFIALPILITLIAVCAAVYFGYGSTMINPDNEKSIINFLSTDKDNPIDILVTKKYGDRFLILYTDPIKVAKNKNSSCFSTFVKNKYYKNRYNTSSLSTGNGTEIQVVGTELEDVSLNEDTKTFAIANVASEETKCSIFEVDPETNRYVSRLDVIDVPKNKPYIIVKEYKTHSKDNVLIAYDGIIELEQLNSEY